MKVDAYKAIISKRDRREYDSARPIPEEVLGRILQAGRMAGSSSNSQPCRFVVLQDQANRDALLPMGRGTAPIGRAPLVIAVLLKEGARDFDVGRTVQNMMLAAWAEGIISCPVGIQERQGARKALGYPEDFEISICVAFGYPDATQTTPPREPRPRLPLEELVHRERW
jgi:nitroreductase